MQKLIAARANLMTEPSHSCASGTENTVESEADGDDQAELETRNIATQPVHSRNPAHVEDIPVKKSGFDEQEVELRSGNQSTFKRKIRLPLRSTQQMARPVGPRRALNRWDSGASRRRGGPSALAGSKKTAIQALRHRCMNEQRSRECTSTEQRHKPGGTYSRFANVQQGNHPQQQQPTTQQQQHQQQRIKPPRVLQRSLHTSKNRPVHLFDSARRRSAGTSKKNKVRPSYMTSGRRLGSKLSQTQGMPLADRADWSSSDQYYFNDEGAEGNTRSVSHASSEDEKNENIGASMMSPHHSTRSIDLASWSKENGEAIEGSEELDDSDYADDDDAIEGASLSLREIKPYCGKDPKSRIPSSPITVAGTPSSSSSVGRNSRMNINRRRVSRIQKLTDSENAYSRVSSERTSVRQTQTSPTSSLDMSSVQPRGSMSATVYSVTSPMNKRREKTNYGGTSRHHRVESKQSARFGPEETANKLSSDNSQKLRHLGSGVEQSSDGSISPDERLYCLCRRTSFGDMIACDNKLCEVEWFHFACVDIRIQPKGKWYCPVCRGDSFKVKRPDL